ncbi:antibiotic biosynthesis monooxygenase family protein [Chloroflexota bacterium]
MYAQMSMITLGPGTRSSAEKLAEQFDPVLKTFKGFKKVTFFGDDAAGEYGSLSIWESKEDAESAAAVLSKKLEQAVSGIAKVPPVRKIYEVYEPRA